jgi:hypothetical protein
MDTYEPEGICKHCGQPLRRDCSTVYVNADGTRWVHDEHGGSTCFPQQPHSTRAEPSQEKALPDSLN